MADNTVLNTGSGGDTIASDDIGGIKFQRVKPAIGADGTATDAVPVSNGMDVTGAAVQAVGLVGQFDDVSVGTVTENQFAPVRISSRRALLVEGVASGTVIPVSDGGGALTVDGTVTANLAAGTNNIGDVDVLSVPAPLSTTGGGTEATALRVTIASDSTGVLSVDDNGGTLTVDGTVTANLAAGTNNIGDVDVLSLPASTNTLEVVGDVAHDAAAAGNPVLVAGAAQACDDTAPPNRISAESDAARLATDFDGSLFVRPHGPQVWSYHSNGSTALTDATVHSSPGAGLSLYVTDIVVSSGAATAMNVFFEESSTTVLGPYYLEAVAGRGLHIKFATPKKITAATALTVTTSAAIAHSVDVTGYTAQG